MNKKSLCVTPPGFEPRLAEPKSDVLPLHHEAMLFKASANIDFFLITPKIKQQIQSISVRQYQFLQRYCVC